MKKILSMLCLIMLFVTSIQAQTIRNVRFDDRTNELVFDDRQFQGTRMYERAYIVYFAPANQVLRSTVKGNNINIWGEYNAITKKEPYIRQNARDGEVRIPILSIIDKIRLLGYSEVSVAIKAMGKMKESDQQYYNSWYSYGFSGVDFEEIPGMQLSISPVKTYYLTSQVDGGEISRADKITVDEGQMVSIGGRFEGGRRTDVSVKYTTIDDAETHFSIGSKKQFTAEEMKNIVTTTFDAFPAKVSGHYKLAYHAYSPAEDDYSPAILVNVRHKVTINGEDMGYHERLESIHLPGNTNTHKITVKSDEPVQLEYSSMRRESYFYMPDCNVDITMGSYNHTVKFIDFDGTVLKTEDVYDGESATPPSYTAPSGYTFKKWNGNYTNVTKDEVVRAELSTFSSYGTFEMTRRYLEHGALFDGKPLPDDYITPGDEFNLELDVKATKSISVRLQISYNGGDWDDGPFQSITAAEANAGYHHVQKVTILNAQNFVDNIKYRFRISSADGVRYTNAIVCKMQYPLTVTARNTDLLLSSSTSGSVGFEREVKKDQSVTVPIGTGDKFVINAGNRHNEFLTFNYQNGSPITEHTHRVLESGAHSFDAFGLADELTIDLQSFKVIFEVAGYNNNRFGPEFQNGLGRNQYDVQTVFGGYPAVIPAIDPKDPTDPNALFLGWKGDDYETDIDLTRITEDYTYAYAVFESVPAPTTYNVTYLDWNGSLIETQELEIGTVGIAPTPSRYGFRFVGWDGDIETTDCDKTLTAAYSLRAYKRGDTDHNKVVNLVDLQNVVDDLTETTDESFDTDVNEDGKRSISDATEMVELLQHPEPALPSAMDLLKTTGCDQKICVDMDLSGTIEKWQVTFRYNGSSFQVQEVLFDEMLVPEYTSIDIIDGNIVLDMQGLYTLTIKPNGTYTEELTDDGRNAYGYQAAEVTKVFSAGADILSALKK